MTIASIPENDRRERFIASAGQTSFPFDFPIYAATDLQVLRERAGFITTLTLGTDYTVIGAGDQAGGSITLTTGAASGDIIMLLSNMPAGRSAQFVNGGDLPAAALEAEFNRLTILFQQNTRDVQASLLYPSTDNPMPALPPQAARANRFLAFDAQGQPIAAGAPDAPLGAVARSGDTMTGPLTLPAVAPATANQATRKAYVDQFWENLLTRANVTPATVNPAQPWQAFDRLYAGNLTAFAANATLTANQAGLVLVDVTGGTRTITLPAADALNGRPLRVQIRRIGSGTNQVIVAAAGTNLIEGAASITLAGAEATAALVSDGENTWYKESIPNNLGEIALDKIQNISTARILGRRAAGSGPLEQIPINNPAAAFSIGIGRSPLDQFNLSPVSVDFLNIPAGVRRVFVNLKDVSTQGTSPLLVQLGGTGQTPGAFLTTGYLAGVSRFGTGVSRTNFTAGIAGINYAAATDFMHGSIILTNLHLNLWVAHGAGFISGINEPFVTGGSVDVLGTLDRVRITTVAGNVIFDIVPGIDSGGATITWEW
jgi:hypothetical protein